MEVGRERGRGLKQRRLGGRGGRTEAQEVRRERGED